MNAEYFQRSRLSCSTASVVFADVGEVTSRLGFLMMVSVSRGRLVHLLRDTRVVTAAHPRFSEPAVLPVVVFFFFFFKCYIFSLYYKK